MTINGCRPAKNNSSSDRHRLSCEFYENKEPIEVNHKYQDEEALSKTQMFLKIMIGLNILLIVLIAFLFIAVNNSDMRIDVLTAQIKEYSAIVSIADESLNDEMTVEVIEEMNEINDSDINKDNFEELVVSGHAIDKSNPYMFTVTGTITNNSDAEQKYDVQVIFYDKSNNPIALESDTYKQIKPGEINGFKVTLLNNVNNVNSYEVKLANKNWQIYLSVFIQKLWNYYYANKYKTDF